MKKFVLFIVTGLLVLIVTLPGCGGGSSYPKCFAYVANSGSGNVTAYSINPTTGALTSVGAIGAGTEPYSITTDPAGNFVYVVNRISKNISIFSINPGSGVLTEIDASPVATIYSPDSMIINRNPVSFYRYAYVANSDAGLITHYSTDSTTGALTYINWLSPISCSNYSWAITADSTGKFIYVATRDSNCISAFNINLSTGGLDSISGSPFSAGTGPDSIIVEPTGKFVYAANWGSNNISAYSITPSTGALAPIGSIPVGYNPRSITVHPSGKFLYVANTNSNSISAFAINTTTGALTQISGSPFYNGANNSTPVSVTVDPTGRFAYVVNNDSDNVQAYAINAKTGGLKAIGIPIAAGHWPVSIITVKK